jgi:hypothetical protein
MENLVPRLVGAPEAKRLGIEGGWYGTKVSGTFVTGPSASLAACIEAIDGIPEPLKIIEAEAIRDTPAKAPPAQSIYAANTQTRTAYQIGRRPGR